ncbi:hypothetical protein H6P81_016094 [Aristolochia fimbriata]|uniref:Integrase catalytic domain-containing protein n=1 Tax=Aristolochia fimbriata TaxID=158543 RepID=A0AAV7E7Q3_ARIFI|nr:hypothetical protein H6P81_016094 [Aristolochia fimbriata]
MSGACLHLFKSSVTIFWHIRLKLISSRRPLKYIMSRPILSRSTGKMGTAPLRIRDQFRAATSNQRASTANFLADHPVPAEWELTEEFPDEEIFLVEVLPPWEMYFDGAARRSGAGAGVLFVSPKKDLLPYSFVLTQACSNNEAEYQAILLGLGMAVEMQIPQLHIYGDSALVIKQLTGEFEEEGLQVLKETHSGICGAHQAVPKLHLQTKRLGYYWPSMLRDAIEMARTCKQCQLHADYIHQAPEPLHPTVASWPFEAWGMDIIGPISPKSDSDRQYILAATDYFSKWAEAAAYREVKAATVVDFIRTQIIYRYGVPGI